MNDTDHVAVTPAMPGFLLIAEIAKLAGLSKTTVNNYRTTGAANFPQPAGRSGSSPMWDIDTVIEWLATRPYAPTVVKKNPDGSLEVTHASTYKEDRMSAKSADED